MKRLSVFQKKSSGATTIQSHVEGIGTDDPNIDSLTASGDTLTVQERQRGRGKAGDGVARPSYRVTSQQPHDHSEGGEGNDNESSYGSEEDEDSVEMDVMGNISKSAGAIRLNRILRSADARAGTKLMSKSDTLFGGSVEKNTIERVSDPQNFSEVALFSGRVVVPPLRVDPNSIGGNMLDRYPDSMIQEGLLASSCSVFESTGSDTVALSSLQYPNEYSKHKRSLGLFGGASNKRAAKLRYVVVARSTNRPLSAIDQQRQIQILKEILKQPQERQSHNNTNVSTKDSDDMSENRVGEDYDAMFATDDDASKDLSMNSDNDPPQQPPARTEHFRKGSILAHMATSKEVGNTNKSNNTNSDHIMATIHQMLTEDEEISSFPVLVCMTLHSDGTGPDIRKLIPLDQLTTVQDLHSTVIQLAFANGDTIRLDFGSGGDGDSHENNKNKVLERPLDKERFLWSLLQIHAMLCMSVVERNSSGTNFLPPLNVRNIDRAELQYVATVNNFLKKSESIKTLLERQQQLIEESRKDDKMMILASANQKRVPVLLDDVDDNENDDDKKGKMDQLGYMDAMAYDLMMGNFATRVTLFHSEEERKDAEEILNSPEWTDLLMSTQEEDSGAATLSERLSYLLQSRMRDLEAETCRRLIAWEDEKHLSLSGRAKLHDAADARDTVDALALASLFKTLESLDSELKSMEDWLQDRAAAIKPLTDDCADIEEENRQLEQQWKSYDMLGAEMRRLLESHEINEDTEKLLKNPASALVYDDDGMIDVDESEDGIEQIYSAGKALLEAMEFPKKSGGMHLKAVSERAKGLTSLSDTYCNSLAQIIVTVMEQFKTEVVAGSDNGKVSKNDTHTMIAKKIRDTQRKFQSALLGYIKLIEILAALSPEMLPALRDAYAEMVAEGILMKKRMKGYFQALPGKNVAYLNAAGKNLKDYVPFQANFSEETVNGPDIRAVLSELLPVIAREAYFVSALFGTNNREQDGREKKRNFENAKNAVDKASMHFRYYMNRTCGIVEGEKETNDAGDVVAKSDPLLCLVATVFLNEAMDNYIDREKKGGDHSLSLAYVRATILDLRKKADKNWVTWVDRQLEWIKSNDGIPTTGKRAGIFPSFARFPLYLDHVILCCKEGREDGFMPDLPSIKVINHYMQRMAVALLESLRECASRESTDQSYAANVMQMENTYFFTQAIKERGDMISQMFARQVTKANAVCKESTDAYLGWMIKREFTALHELFSRVSKIRKDFGDGEVGNHVPTNQFVKILQKEASRDMMKEKITSLYSRMEKHISEDGDLLPVAWKALVKVLFEWFGRWEKLCTAIYQHKLDPSPVDIVRIAKAAGGQAKVIAPVQGTEFGFKSILALGNKQSAAPPP